MKSIKIADQTYAAADRLAKVFGVSTDKCIERLLTRFVFDPLNGELNAEIAVEAEQIICSSRSEAKALADRLESFGIQL
jgi:hypothetical protein